MHMYLPGCVPDAQSVLMFLLPLHGQNKAQSLCPSDGRSVWFTYTRLQHPQAACSPGPFRVSSDFFRRIHLKVQSARG